MSDEPKEVELKDLPAEDQKEIREGALEYVRTVGHAKKQKESSKNRKRKGGAMHKRGSHWYELEAFFDPKLIEATPIENSGFMLGILEDFVVVEYKKDMTSEAIDQIGHKLNAMGLKAMMVPEGIRFMRLRGVTDEEERTMNEFMEDRKAAEAEKPEKLDS